MCFCQEVLEIPCFLTSYLSDRWRSEAQSIYLSSRDIRLLNTQVILNQMMAMPFHLRWTEESRRLGSVCSPLYEKEQAQGLNATGHCGQGRSAAVPEKDGGVEGSEWDSPTEGENGGMVP
ncbi:unnamed protein product [Eretmochelys imbricata]